MKKSLGITLTTGILSAALLPGLFGAKTKSKASPPVTPLVKVQAAAQAGEKDGPWNASCSYWRPGDDTTGAAAPSCSSTHWGLPVRGGGTPEITAIIATVPDPIHSSMALEFDRSIDVLTQAAAEYRFIASYYWLPWKRVSAADLKNGSAEESPSGSEDESAKEPGLLILRQSCAFPAQTAVAKMGQTSCKDEENLVLYLFLVGQSPALGMDGEQLQRALRYEMMLASEHSVHLSFHDSADPGCKDQVAVIGPNYSGSAASLWAGLNSWGPARSAAASYPVCGFAVAGITSTPMAAESLNHPNGIVHYTSFFDESGFDQEKIRELFGTMPDNTKDYSRIAFLAESGTALGAASTGQGPDGTSSPLYIHFPREISVLRNAQNENTDSPQADAEIAASPYLHLSLSSKGIEDTVPHYATSLAPFSQEAQWMTISRELKRRHVQVVAISASNILDELFLAKSIHRDLPDARLVLRNSDLMFVRYGDNQPYLGAVALTAYPMINLSHPEGEPTHLQSFANASAEALFNAAVYTFWRGDGTPLPLADYRNPFDAMHRLHPPLWANTVGRDGFYPLGIADQDASPKGDILPVLSPGTKADPAPTPGFDPIPTPQPGYSLAAFPPLSWYVLCLAIIVLCMVHTFSILNGRFWSVFSRDLAIGTSDEPRRRSVYIHIALASLSSMCFITVFPVVTTKNLMDPDWITLSVVGLALFCALLAVVSTLYKTHPYWWAATRKEAPQTNEKTTKGEEKGDAAFLPWFNGLALATAIILPALWAWICADNFTKDRESYLGVFFSYRCLYLASGVSPLLPIVLLLATWYLWAFLQTRRLRFSPNNHPKLPSARHTGTDALLYVSEDALASTSLPADSCLYENVTCLLITRQLLKRHLRRSKLLRDWFARHKSVAMRTFNVLLAAFYVLLFGFFIFFLHIEGLDHFLRTPGLLPSRYELLTSALFYPLLVIAITGCVRMLVIWSSLTRGLLDPLERSPLRFAFTRLPPVPWINMLRQDGLLEYGQDMSRCNEVILQLAAASREGGHEDPLQQSHERLKKHVQRLIDLVSTPSGTCPPLDANGTMENCLRGTDLPLVGQRGILNLMCALESDYVGFSDALLKNTLIPFWTKGHMTSVNSKPQEAATPGSGDSDSSIQLAEEFLVIRYVAVIRSILINLRLLMTFVASAFVLAILAWNSYPFQPRQWVDWAFTFLLLGIGTGVVWVFAQMHRNPILSRITDTAANELGVDFFLRILTFGGVPVLTWLASQFPGIGSGVFNFLESGLKMVK